jgi:peptide chain release factor 2
VVVVLDDNQSRSNTIQLNSRDVRIDTFRTSGAGGQHRNKTDSGVRLTHEPTGISVTATEERSQHQNREIGWKRLRAKIQEINNSQFHEIINGERNSHFDSHRDWSWTSWRDEVKNPKGVKDSMKKILNGRFEKILS